MHIFLSLILGFFVGTVSGLAGIGGGVFMVPVFVYFFKMDIHRAVGTSLAVAVFITLSGSLRHYLSGNVDIKSVIFFALAAIIGGWAGATLAQVIPAHVLRKIFAVVLAGIAIHMFWKG